MADAISQLEYTPIKHEQPLSVVFANRSNKYEIFPLTVKEIAKAQKADHTLQKQEKYESILIENTSVLCKDGKLVIPKSLQHRVVSWYHHYLQHPGNTCLEETLRAVMCWKNLEKMSGSYVKTCKSCQDNKHKKQKYVNSHQS